MSNIDKLYFQTSPALSRFPLSQFKTVEKFRCRKLFYLNCKNNFLDLSNFFVYSRNCLRGLQLKRALAKCLKPPLQPFMSETSFPSKLLQINLVGPLQSICPNSYRFFYKTFFVVYLTNARGDTIVHELVGIFF